MTPDLLAPITRSVPVADVALDDGVLEALFVPWDTPITVYGDPDEPEPYREGFRRTAFDEQLERFPATVHEVGLKASHTSSERLGVTRSLKVVEAGLHGVVKVLQSRRGDVRELIEEGFDSVSIEFHPLQRRARRDGSGVRWRDRAFLSGLVLTSVPAYHDAKVLAMRSAEAVRELRAERDARVAAAFADLDEIKAAGARWHAPN